MWSVAPPTLDEARERFDSDGISYLDGMAVQLESAIQRATEKGGTFTLHTLPNTVEFPALPARITKILQDKGEVIKQESGHLLDALHVARLTKDDHEIGLIREANRISSAAHEVLMRNLGRSARNRTGKGVPVSRNGKEDPAAWQVESEGDAEALFVAACKRLG